MDRVDEMSQDIVKYNTYLRNTSKQQQQKHQVGFSEQSESHQLWAKILLCGFANRMQVANCRIFIFHLLKYRPVQKANPQNLDTHYMQNMSFASKQWLLSSSFACQYKSAGAHLQGRF